MKYRKTPPSSTVNRMARYLNYLTLLPASQTHVNSKDISDELGIKPSQFRQDFHYFGGFGRPGLGYEKKILIKALEEILGVDRPKNIIVIGVGHLGTALANYRYFERLNVRLVGLFDTNPKLIGLSLRGVEIMHPDSIPEFVQKHDVQIAILTTPPEVVQRTCDQVVIAGIKGIWNFTAIHLETPAGFIVRNEQPALGLLALTFLLTEFDHSGDEAIQKRKTFSLD